MEFVSDGNLFYDCSHCSTKVRVTGREFNSSCWIKGVRRLAAGGEMSTGRINVCLVPVWGVSRYLSPFILGFARSTRGLGIAPTSDPVCQDFLVLLSHVSDINTFLFHVSKLRNQYPTLIDSWKEWIVYEEMLSYMAPIFSPDGVRIGSVGSWNSPVIIPTGPRILRKKNIYKIHLFPRDCTFSWYIERSVCPVKTGMMDWKEEILIFCHTQQNMTHHRYQLRPGTLYRFPPTAHLAKMDVF